MANETLAVRIAEELDRCGYFGDDPADPVGAKSEIQFVLDAEPAAGYLCDKCKTFLRANKSQPGMIHHPTRDRYTKHCGGTLKKLIEG